MVSRSQYPNFFIVGAAKSGTTSLYEYLRVHPQVFMPEWKEPAYFAPGADGLSNWDEYIELFSKVRDEPRVGESSVAYLASPEAPAQMSGTLGKDLKIIVLLREPVSMAYSNWGHQSRENYEDKSFFDALGEEDYRVNDPEFRRLSRTWYLNRTYIERARYYPQVKRYIEEFGRENVRVYLYEEFFAAGLPLYADLLGFLSIDPQQQVDNRVFNQSGGVRSPLIARILKSSSFWKEPLKLVLPKDVRMAIMKRVESFNRVVAPLPPIEAQCANLIRSRLDADVRKLADLIGRNDLLSIWGWDRDAA